MGDGKIRPLGGTPGVFQGAGQLVKVPLEVAIIHQDLAELVQVTRDLVQIQKELNNALVALALARKEEANGADRTA